MMPVNEKEWTHDLQDFIQYWEKEVDELKERKVNSDECCEIVELFHRDRDLLLSRRPSAFTDEDVIVQIEPIANKLDVSLAMALCSAPE